MDASAAAVQQAYAAWVQAIAAAIGIGLTVGIYWGQSKALRRQMNAGKLALLDGILAIFEDVEIALHEVTTQWDSATDPRPAQFEESKARILQALVALNELPLHEIQPYDSMRAFLSAKKLLADCVHRFDRNFGAIELNGNRINDFREWAEEFAQHRAVIYAQARLLRK